MEVRIIGGALPTVVVPSRFDPARRPVIVAPVANMSHRAWELQRLLRGLYGVLRRSEGRVLVHAASWRLASEIAAERPLDRPVASIQDRTEALRWLERHEDGVLVVAGFERGVDLPYDACRTVVVAKVPFPSLGDRQTSARLHSPGGQLWYAASTARRLVQSTGRGMRAEDDSCTSWILDASFVTWWRRWRWLLPEWWTDALVWNFPVATLLTERSER